MTIKENEKTISSFVYNDLTEICPWGNSLCLELEDKGEIVYIPVNVDGENAQFGVWMEFVPVEQFFKSCEYIFDRFEFVKRITFKNYPVKPEGKYRTAFETKNHWSISLPKSDTELDQRLSSKKRYNIKREKRLAGENIGEYETFEYKADSVPESIIKSYFAFKQVTYGIDYGMTAEEYLATYHVTDVYALMFEDIIGAIVCSCEQKENVYLENLTYNPELSKYSLGAILYDEYLKILIKKCKKCLYLGYGHQQYKALYGAVETEVYTGTVYRTKRLFFKEIKLPDIKRRFRALLRRLNVLKIRDMLRKLRSI